MATIDVKDAADNTVAIERPLAPGRGAASASRPVVLSTEDKTALDAIATAANQTAQSTLFGGVSETAPGTDTASSGLNGRLQRIAQRLTSLIALLPSSLGSKTSANSLAVVVASDQTLSSPEVGDVVLIGTTQYTVKRAYVDASASGSTQVVALVSTKKLRVLSYELIANGAVNIHFRSNATQISSTKYAPQAGWGIARSHNSFGYFETSAGETLNVNLSAAVSVGVQITYIEV